MDNGASGDTRRRRGEQQTSLDGQAARADLTVFVPSPGTDLEVPLELPEGQEYLCFANEFP